MKYADDKRELWQTSSQPLRRLVHWDAALEQTHFDVVQDRLVVRYSNQQAYLLDLAWLRAMAMGGQADTLPMEELIRLACAGPFANPQVWDAAAEARFQEYLAAGVAGVPVEGKALTPAPSPGGRGESRQRRGEG